ncbi:MAG: twitching motility protein PilT [Desulfobulbaceae bacterium A2]|nr:MAG: twitching motility protein PilT [Desulfobulbaceae bacterium A2]
MKVIVDTVIWSLALRRGEPQEEVRQQLTSLIEDQRILLLGPIRQEVLSGYSEKAKFEKLRNTLSHFDNEPVLDEDYIRAAEFHNTCRRQGIQGSHTDFLICSCAYRLKALIYTKDDDFHLYHSALPVSLYQPAKA